jgi:two-component system KDP operon response regulator KdpE
MHTKSPTILVIEDSLSIRRFLKTAIMSQDYQFLESGTGNEGLELSTANKPDIILLDLGLPDIDGLAVIKALRSWTSIPIIVLSARDQESDKVMALDLGADDYLTKPFSIGELNARLRVALRHAERINDAETPIFETGYLKIDLVNHYVWIDNKLIMLSPTQFAILAALVRSPNKIVTHKQLLKEVWGDNHAEDIDYVRIYIHQLRHKLERNPCHPKYFKTEAGIGYRFVCEMQK